jgi:hypothetical protein
MRHMVGAVDVEMQGPGAARARFYCSYVHVGAEANFAGLGEYEDLLTQEADGKWRVKTRHHIFLTPLNIRAM